jgi:Flagellar hook-length control protein FliK
MNGIDAALASALTSRVDSLLNIAPGSATTSQTGAAGLNTAPTATPSTAADAPPPSTQTALSAVALTLDAIARSGGDVTLAVLGQTPIWPAAPALDVGLDGLPLFETATASNASGADPATAEAAGTAGAPGTAGTTAAGTTNTSATAGASGTTAATGAAATANVAAAQVPIAALAAALEQTVSDSGLFYEAHLAQWLSGQRSPASLANEAQNKLVADASQLPLDWSLDDSDAAAPHTSNASTWQGTGAASNGQPNGGAADANAATRPMPSILTAQAARLVAGEVLANSVSDLSGQPTHASLHSAMTTQSADAASSQDAPSTAAAVHPATIPLVRQQLDLLATGQFRWTGEAWPGARLDWTIEQDGDEWDRSGGGTESVDDQPWRTRLTLSLPTLGTVDAELTLTGMRLVARVQASPNGAARLAMQGESFRQRLAAAGIELNGLTIREIGGGAPAGGTSAAGAQAASAYARSASAATAAATSTGTAGATSATSASSASSDAKGGSNGAANRAATRTANRTTNAAAPGRRTGTAPPDDFDWDI